MPRRHRKIERRRAGRFLRIGQDLFSITLEDRLLWRIFLPVADNDGFVFLDRHHKKFSDRVLNVSGGSTENPWSAGKWINEGRLHKERMIPLEFLATTEQADMIAAFAAKHYDQIEIMCYPISDRVRLYRLGRAVVIIVSAVAELERNLIIERVRAGLRRAKLEGRQLGRRPSECFANS